MGVVYLARDTRLKRPVAIKLLNHRTLTDAAARDELLQEGRAASALNHHNICTVHGVEEIDNQTFIVMEYVEGSRLSGVIPTGGLPVETVLRYGIQIADGLEHAHERGVIHGDLKTANVMVTPGGRIKVLDFGLARRAFAEAAEDTTLAEDSGRNTPVTGTLSYMAPEILRGEPRRAASDVWSLGVLLYELSCGELPFSGRTSFELTAAILRSPAAPLPAHVPPAVRAVIQHCLTKDPGQRYRRVGEVRAALEAIDTSVRLPLPAEGTATAGRARGPRFWATALGAATLVLVLPATWWYRSGPPASTTVGGNRLIQIVSSEGPAFDPTLSPDGRMIAYAAETAEGVDLFIADARGEGRVRLTEDAAREEHPRFSPDGTRLLFSRLRPGATTRELCLIPVLGGQTVMIVERATQAAWAPDGLRIAFVRFPSGSEPAALVTANVDGSDPRTLLVADGEFPFIMSPSWSPDGDQIVVVRNIGGAAGQLWVVPASGGAPRRLSNDPAAVFSDEPVFAPDGRGVIHSSNRSGAVNLWVAPLDGSAPVRLTTGAGPDAAPSVARDGSIVFTNSRRRYVLVVHDLAKATARTLVTHASYVWAPAFSPNGQEIAYSQAEVDGSWHIWAIPAAGGTARRLSSTPQGEIYPRYAPDGNAILYHNWNEPRRIWQVAPSGGPPTRLAWSEGPDDGYADVAPNGSAAAFVRTEGRSGRVYVAPIGGGTPRMVVDTPGAVPRWSPNGEWIAFSPSRGFASGVFVVRPDGTGLRRVSDRGGWPVWWPDGTKIAYLMHGEDGNQVIETVPFEGGLPTRLASLRFLESNYPIAVSPDGLTIATSNSVHVSDEIWLLTR